MFFISEILKQSVGLMVYFILSLMSIPKYIIVDVLPSLPWKIGNIVTQFSGKFTKIITEAFSDGLLKFGGIIEMIVNTIVKFISDSVNVGAAVTSPLTFGFSGAVGVTVSTILEFIITSMVSIIVAGLVIYITAYGLYTMLYYIFYLFAGIFIAKLFALVFVTLFIWVIVPVLSYFKPTDIRNFLFGIIKRICSPIMNIFRKFSDSERKIFRGGHNITNEPNYNIHIQFLTLLFLSLLIIALLSKVYELYYEKLLQRTSVKKISIHDR